MITGKQLIAMGYRPGKWFAPALEHINAHRLTGEALRNYLDEHQPLRINPRPRGSVGYHLNLRAETAEEEENVRSVQQSMDELMTTPTLVAGAVMPDACPTGTAGQIPVGGIAVTENAIHPGMHSADVCCSVMMSNLGMADPKSVLNAAQAITHFGGGGRTDTFALPEQLAAHMKRNPFLNDPKSRELAISHLGTQGDGNHFLYVGQLESTGETILVTHHGSRGLGANLYTQGMQVAERFRRERAPKTASVNAWIPFDEEEGQTYWEALQLVRDWTKLNHGLLHDRIADAAAPTVVGRFWNEHNFVFRDGTTFYHAKGATPLEDRFVPDSHDGLRLIPLNMAEPILVIRGSKNGNNLGFAPHGAGRNRSRRAHLKLQYGRPVQEVLAEETGGLDVRFFSGHPDLSELPSAYKNADAVQRQMAEFGLGEVVDRILPYGCIMAGDWKKDAPWRRKKRATGR